MSFLMQELGVVLAIFVVSNVAYVLGSSVLRALKAEHLLDEVFEMGLSVLIGFGIIAYITLFITFFTPFTGVLALILGAISLIFGFKRVISFNKKIIYSLRSVIAWNRLEKILFGVVVFLFLFYLSSAFAPPYRVDALTYHLPIVSSIASRGIFSITKQGIFFENLPLLMETSYAFLYKVGGYTAIHLGHYQLCLFGLLLVYSTLARMFSRSTGLWAVILTFTVYELWVNATNAYVDAGTAFYQLAGLLLIWQWLQKRDNKMYLVMSGICFGFALASKYLALYGLLLGCLFVLFGFMYSDLPLKKKFSHLLCFVVPIGVCAGFWYMKNAIVLGNPVYPFIFGHVGISGETMQSIVSGIKEYRPRTLKNFLTLPILFFSNSYYISVLLAFAIAPLALLVKKNRPLIFYIASFTFCYFTVWFFFISHQVRFAMLGLVTLMMLVAIAVGWLQDRYYRFFSSIPFILVAVIFFSIAVRGIVVRRDNYFLKVKRAEISYMFGLSSATDFYDQRNLGDIYRLSMFIDQHFKNTIFLNLWTDYSTSFFLKNNTFAEPNEFVLRTPTIDASSTLSYFSENKITHVIGASDKLKKDILQNSTLQDNPNWDSYYKTILEPVSRIDALLPFLGKKMYEENNRVFYQINF